MEEKEVKKEKVRFYSKFFRDIKNVRKNMNIVRSSPYASLKFRYSMQKVIIILLCAFLLNQFYAIIINYNGGSSVMTLVGRAIVLLILVIIINSAFKTLKPLKEAIKHYELHPEHNKAYRNINVRKEIDDILNKFEDENMKGGKK